MLQPCQRSCSKEVEADLLLGDAHVVLDPGEDGGLDEQAGVVHGASSTLQQSPLLLTALDQLHDLVKLLSVNLRVAVTSKRVKDQESDQSMI